MMPGLLVRDGISEGNPRDLQLYLFSAIEEGLLIGRADTCHIVLDDPEVELVHLVLMEGQGGLWRVHKKGEAAFKVNGKEVESRKLRNGDTIQVGNSELQFFEPISLEKLSSPSKGETALPEVRQAPQVSSPSAAPAPPEEQEVSLSPEEEDLLYHPDLKAPGIYLTHGGILGEFIAIRGHVLIGRGSQCTLVFRDGDVSRTHASLELTPEGKVILTDLASRNGVYVNDRRIEHSCTLRGFDLVRMGNTEFIFFENEENIQRFRRLIQRGSILLHKVSRIGASPSQSHTASEKVAPEKQHSLSSVFPPPEEGQGEEKPEPKVQEKNSFEDPTIAPPIPVEKVSLVCIQCGSKNPQEAQFCQQCGKELRRENHGQNEQKTESEPS